MTRRIPGWTGAALLAATLAACAGGQRSADRAAFEHALDRYLAQRGDLCLAKYDWPIDISAQDLALGSRDAVQLPVLEQLGVVRSTQTASGAQRYALTAEGQRSYRAREVPARAGAPAHHGDFCAARLSLDQVVGWEFAPQDPQHRHAVVTYTYRVEASAWAQDPRARRVFPAVARVLDGARHAQLRQAFVLGADGWVAQDGPA